MTKAEYTPLPDGDYVGEIISVSTEKAEEGYTIVDCRIQILGGDFDKVFILKRYHLKNIAVANLLKQEFARIGIPIADKNEFPQKKDQAVGVQVAIKAQTKEDSWVSYYFKKAVKNAGENTTEDDEGVAPDAIDFEW